MSAFKEIIIATDAIKQLDELIESEEIDKQTYDDSMEIILESINSDVDSLRRYRTTLEARINECKLHEQQIKSYKKSLETKIERLDKFLLNAMIMTKQDCFYGNTSEIKKRKSKYVNIYDLKSIPKEYIIEKTEVIPDKNKIKEAINSGAVIDGANIEIKDIIKYK